ncbi:1,4-dihydroxy-2-naphthoate octaprenyltransferase [Neisseria weixii]|uniref:1,4-dihydroxy-2-naphthoate octaprenyltransferase n=1 Tax=Neisseria weixii TaxID=1853276 RepID=UPI001F34E905|nr:1,4-dihydroxy-2-naphthoate octaprenyltransferase [Neisseria weixii]
MRTLPLATASTLCGCLLAALQQSLHWPTAILTIATAVALQIFSNLANQRLRRCAKRRRFGRQGPPRMVAAGRISRHTMQKGLAISAGLCCLLGIALLATALPALAQSSGKDWLVWLLLGATALAAAYGYTAGRKPYGYISFGDAAVFVFFGRLAVLGSEYLHTGRLNTDPWLPARWGCGAPWC